MDCSVAFWNRSWGHSGTEYSLLLKSYSACGNHKNFSPEVSWLIVFPLYGCHSTSPSANFFQEITLVLGFLSPFLCSFV